MCRSDMIAVKYSIDCFYRRDQIIVLNIFLFICDIEDRLLSFFCSWIFSISGKFMSLFLFNLSLLRIFKFQHYVTYLILFLQLVHSSYVSKIRHYSSIQIYLTHRLIIVGGLAYNPHKAKQTGHPAIRGLIGKVRSPKECAETAEQ